MKIPKYLQSPVTQPIEIYGMRRAIKVIEIEIKDYKKSHGLCDDEIDALDRVYIALKASINKENPVAESVTLNWGE